METMSEKTTSEWTERPILYDDRMVRAILDGRKTQTRRIARLNAAGRVKACPYGKPGDRLWVREAWATDFIFDDLPPCNIPEDSPLLFRADESATGIVAFEWGKWRPSIHMPRWASRIVLEIIAVRLERLQDISEADAEAEGMDVFQDGAGFSIPFANGKRSAWHRHLKDAFRVLWESINGTDSWAENPRVWAVEFRKLEVKR